MLLSTNYYPFLTPTAPVTLHGVGSWLRRARDVPNDQRVLVTPPFLEAPVKFSLASAVAVKAPLYPMTDGADNVN